MKHIRFEENILVDEAYSSYGQIDKNADQKNSQGIAKHFAETLEYEEKKKWFHQMPQEPATISKKLNQEQVEELKKEASSALYGDTSAYETRSNKSGGSDHQWARTLLNKGAIGDRVAAATILIQDSPIHNLTALRNLISNVKPAKKKDGIVIIDALSELLVADLLIPDVKLRTFEQHPLGYLDDMTSGNKQARRNILKLWYYEDQLKELYASYVEALSKFAHDAVEANREKAVSAMAHLLMHHPEREKVLLTNIVNKLGDPAASVASKSTYHLCQLLYNHPNMKEVVLKEVEKMLFRSNVSGRAQYYGVCLLGQFYLGKDDGPIADNLIRIYFSFFKANIKKGEIDSRLMSAVLTGVKRAQPFSRGGGDAHTAAIYKLVHLAGPGVAVNALALLFHSTGPDDPASDRYYTALYRKLSQPTLFGTSHAALLFSLIYKSLKRDKDCPRVAAFVKRLLQLACLLPAAHSCALLFLISQVLKDGDKKEAIRLVWTKREIKEETKKEVEEDSQEESETNQRNTKANEFASDDPAGTEDVKPEQKKVDMLKGNKRDLLDDDEEENYVDLKLDEEGNIRPRKRKHGAAPPGWFHARVKVEPDEDQETGSGLDKKIAANIIMKKTINMDKEILEYNGLARNPSHCGSLHSAYTELQPLAKHYHPTVRLFADKLRHEQIIQYSGDPLKDFSGIRFLDRFAFKNPKQRVEPPAEDSGVKKVKGSHPKFAVRKNYSAKGLRSLPVTSASYLNEDAVKIPLDERFLYDFLQKRRSAQEDNESDSDAESVGSEDFEQYLDSITGTRQDDSDDELDYLGEMEASRSRRPDKRASEADEPLGSDEGSDGDDQLLSDDEGSDGELEISGDEEEPLLSADEDELALEGSDEEEEFVNAPRDKKGKNKDKLKLKLKGKDNLSSLFASAEEFSTLLEETASTKHQGSSQAASLADGAAPRQLAWEEKRDHWIKGYNRKILGKKGNRAKKFAKNPPNYDKKPNMQVAKRKRGNANAGVKRKKTK